MPVLLLIRQQLVGCVRSLGKCTHRVLGSCGEPIQTVCYLLLHEKATTSLRIICYTRGSQPGYSTRMTGYIPVSQESVDLTALSHINILKTNFLTSTFDLLVRFATGNIQSLSFSVLEFFLDKTDGWVQGVNV